MKRRLIYEYNSLEHELEKLVLIESIISKFRQFEINDLLNDLIFVLCNDNNCVIRHEAAFTIGQLSLSENIENLINVNTLIKQLEIEKSTVVKHEILESLGFLKSEVSRECLYFYQSSIDIDLSDTARVSLERSLLL